MDAAAPIPLYIGRYSARAGQDFPAHSHSGWELVYYTAGRVRAAVGEEVFDAMPGVLIATPPGVEHSEAAVGAYENIYLGLSADPLSPWPTLVRDDADGRILRVLDALMAERDPGDGMVRLLSRELDLLLRRATDASAAPSSAADLVARAEVLMRGRLGHPPRLAALADELAVAPSTLRAAFVRERGMPPSTRFAELRLQLALGQLRTSTLTLESVARLAGYASASHLSRQVRAATGMSPGEVRRLYRAGLEAGAS